MLCFPPRRVYIGEVTVALESTWDRPVATSRDTRRSHPGAADGQTERELLGLMGAYEAKIFTFLLTVLGDTDAALDCSQETFLGAYENLRRGRPVNAAWLYKVARSRAMREFRHRKRLRSSLEALESAATEHRHDLRLAVRQALEQLSPQDQRILYLSDVAGFRADEIAGITRAGAPAVRQRLSRARARFRRVYGPTY